MCAPCANHKPRPVREDARPYHPSTNTQSTTTKNRQPTRMKTLESYSKRPTQIPRLQQVKLPDNIGKYVVRDAEEVTRLGWTKFVRRR